ncbi:hypothetical protein EMIT0P100_60169 [Pseudomonas sp. IT-P100]
MTQRLTVQGRDGNDRFAAFDFDAADFHNVSSELKLVLIDSCRLIVTSEDGFKRAHFLLLYMSDK